MTGWCPSGLVFPVSFSIRYRGAFVFGFHELSSNRVPVIDILPECEWSIFPGACDQYVEFKISNIVLGMDFSWTIVVFALLSHV